MLGNKLDTQDGTPPRCRGRIRRPHCLSVGRTEFLLVSCVTDTQDLVFAFWPSAWVRALSRNAPVCCHVQGDAGACCAGAEFFASASGIFLVPCSASR